MNPFKIPIDTYLDFDKLHNFGIENGSMDIAVQIKCNYKPIVRLKSDLEKCKKNPELLKYFFNLHTTFKDIEKDIDEKQNNLTKFINDNTVNYINSFNS